MAFTQAQANTYHTEVGDLETARTAVVTAQGDYDSALATLKANYSGPASVAVSGQEYIVYQDSSGEIKVVEATRVT